ncbi:RICIN domain-containing protein [Kitasatospora sp. NPDC048298]|uniref:RICIN domain-containing protein n=1 Tax=Kitasatospora sp. NPDC048298 TaxID=3364049 RepID=UPI00370FD464
MKKLFAFLGAATLVALPMGGAASAETTTTSPSLQSVVHLVNDHSGQCLVSRGYGESYAQQYTCDYNLGTNWADQHWNFTGSSWDDVQVRNDSSSLCLAVRGGDNNATAVQTTCGAWPDQHWQVRFDPNGNGHFMLANRYSGKCLAVQGFTNDTVAIQFDCNNGYQDQWWHAA